MEIEHEDFNLFKNLGLNENQHSNLLGKLLHPKGKHGQGNLFLKEFVESINSPFDEKDKWFVTTGLVAGERGFVDLFLHNQYQTIIIENKVHGAINQPHQLYRYWKNHIYDKVKVEYETFCKEKDGDLRNLKSSHIEFYNTSEIRSKFSIIYLTKNKLGSKQKSKEDFSKSKQIHPFYRSKYDDLPEELPIKVIELSYKINIVKWLSESLGKISNKSCSDVTAHHLEVVLIQYIEFLKKYL